MSTAFRCDFDVSPKLRVTVINDDIINVKAGAVVTGEGPDLEKESFVTQALQRKSPSFKDIRRDIKTQCGKLQLLAVYTSQLGIPFNYVIHAVLGSSQRSPDWLKDMKTLYRRIFAAAKGLPIRTVAVPLLGAGYAESDTNLSIRAIAESVIKFSPKYKINVRIVNTNPLLFGAIITQLEESMKRNSNKDFLSKCGSKINNVVGKVSDILFQPEQYNFRERGKCMEPRVYSEYEEELQAALRISEEEAERARHARRKEDSLRGASTEKPSNTLWYSESNTTWYPDSYIDQSSSDDGSNSSSGYGSMTYNSSHSESVNNRMRTAKRPKDSGSDTEVTCPICLSAILVPKQLDKCGHIFCEDCIERSFRDFKPVCPCCNMVYGVITGNQPDGTMDVGFSSQSLPGYPGCGAITITYNIPSGIQQEGHPSPGHSFTGTTRRAYLPDCKEGKVILTLLRIAFDRKLTFTIGRSTTTGRDGVVTWNDIHHKTNMDGGPTRYGYPDPTYLSRVRDELACKGVTDVILTSA